MPSTHNKDGQEHTLPDKEDLFFTFDDAPFEAPFQPSGEAAPVLSPLEPESEPSTAPEPALKRRRWKWRVAGLTIMLAVGVLLLLLYPVALPVPTADAPKHPLQPTQQPSPTASPPESSALLPVPNGWKQAGLTPIDALSAQRVAIDFVQAEMNLDYRNAGIREQHGGTFTAAMAFLSPAAKERFLHYDRRMINNVLFDQVQQQQLVQMVLHPSTQIHKIQQNGDELFAWVDVSFTLYQSLADQTGKRDEHTVLDPKTQKPLIQHMQVLLLAGLNTATGQSWLVTTYALNAPPPEILDVP
uniref:Uncharacterized protein n=1 Tax=Thermosporothrix sp. COM3 TaxID=2490863 RepID=A0A455SFF1_9CHLR|nr:hypothetical protein KTC_19440 [Thermosporothrix sp. COM3]